MGASVEMMTSIGARNIQERALNLNRYLTDGLIEAGWKVLSPIASEESRSAETLVAVEDPAGLVARLASQRIIVTEKPRGIRVATDFFNNEADIETLIQALGKRI